MNERAEHGSPTEGPAIAADGLSRMLIVLPGWAGDCALATPALRAIRHAMPRVTIGALVHANLAPLFDPCPWIDELVLVPPRRSRVPDSWPAGLVTTVRAMTAGRFDLVLLLRGGFRSALEARLAGIPRRVGFSGDLRGALLTTAIPRPRGTSTPESYLLLSRALGADGDLRLELQTHPDDDRHAAALLDSISEGGRRGVLLLSPGGPRAAKLWGDERFAAVARRGHEELGLAIVLNGSPDDASRLRRVASLAGVPSLDLGSHSVDLRLLKSLVARSRVVVGNDSGPRHLAAALGIPSVTVFGPTDPAATPNGSRLERHVRASTWCSPCEWRRCPIGHGCMKNVSVDVVVRAVADAVSGGEGTGPA